MADPFSIAAGTTGVIDVCWRVGKFLVDLKSAAGKVEQELSALSSEIDALVKVSDSIQAVWFIHAKELPCTSSEDASRIENLWRNTSTTLEGCRSTIEKLGNMIEKIIGKHGHIVTSKVDGIRKALRKQFREDEVIQIRLTLASYQNNLQILLTALDFCYARHSQSSTDFSLGHLSEEVESLGFKLQNQIAAIRWKGVLIDSDSMYSAIIPAADVVAQLSLNRHFDLPHAVSSIFTGRGKLLKDLKETFDTSKLDDNRIQKRFVIYGLSGSGKTEFCCKFAQDNRQCFWGIFYINASSSEDAKRSYSNIARVGGVDPNEKAAKNWLANLDRPWLLLIDNADDPYMTLDQHFPEGERGFVLITTRVPSNKSYGTLGSYYFEKLDTAEASDLLLKAAGEPRPWTTFAKDSAAAITRKLGFLPLALVHAGKAIMRRLGMCTLGNYIEVYDRSWRRIRRARSSSKYRGSNDEVAYMNVYSSYEIIFRGLETTDSTATQDAVQLLKTFSFFSYEDLRIDLLLTAVKHPKLHLAHVEKESVENKADVPPKPRSWSQTIRDWAIWIFTSLEKEEVPILPALLREEEDEASDRLADALDHLTRLSLVNYQEETKSYSMHPLVHTWIRERPGMSTGEQAVWCQAARTTLTQSILLPPLDSLKSAEALRQHLVPHVSHVLQCQENILSRFHANQTSRKGRVVPVLTPGFGRKEALELAKFSFVYFQNGFFAEAEKLQVPVQSFVVGRLGLDHPMARKVTLFLSATYGHQMRVNKAAELLEQVLQACENSLGPTSHDTLKVMDDLGATRCHQGRYKESRELLQRAIEGMMKTLGPNHVDTLKATDNLGLVTKRYSEYEEARHLHAKAADGLTEILGPVHEKTLVAKENLAMAHINFEGDLLDPDFGETAHDLLLGVLDERRKKLGKEQPYTLLAILNLARIKSARGSHVEAETLINSLLPIAKRNLGENHAGTLAGRTHLAQTLVRQERYEEAESMLENVIERQRYEIFAGDDGEHPDRIAAMWYLVLCYEKHGKIEDATRVCNALTKAVSTIGGQGLGLLHPFATKLRKKQDELKETLRTTNGGDVKEVSPTSTLVVSPAPSSLKNESETLRYGLT